MSTRAIMIVLYLIGFGSLILLFDSVVGSIGTESLDLTAEKIGQSRFVYLFGAFGAALGLMLVGLLDRRTSGPGPVVAHYGQTPRDSLAQNK